MGQQQSELTLLLLLVVVSFICTTVLLMDPESDVCDLVKRTDDCLFTLKGK